LHVFVGARKFPVDLSCGMGEVLTVSHLLTKLEELTEVPIDKQKLLYKGKTLKEPKQYLTDVGLTDNAIIMLLGKKPDLTEDKEMQKMNEIEKSMEKQATRLNEITYELDGIHRGFMDEAVRNDALKQIGKNLRGMTESFMKLLESLDGLQLESHNYGGRGKRKTLVDKIQVKITT
ncbi:hypothetical protein FSP39_000915, partial [Pinctada imbricata]